MSNTLSTKIVSKDNRELVLLHYEEFTQGELEVLEQLASEYTGNELITIFQSYCHLHADYIQ